MTKFVWKLRVGIHRSLIYTLAWRLVGTIGLSDVHQLKPYRAAFLMASFNTRGHWISKRDNDFVNIVSESYGLRPQVSLPGPLVPFPTTIPDPSKMSGLLTSLGAGTFISLFVIHSSVLRSPRLGSSLYSQQKLSFYYQEKNNTYYKLICLSSYKPVWEI